MCVMITNGKHTIARDSSLARSDEERKISVRLHLFLVS